MGEFEVNVRSYEESETQEPIDSERFTLTMQGKDQPGIIARTSAHLADRGINLDDYYAYVQDGVLLMLAQVSVPAGVDVDEVQRGLQQMGLDFGLVVHLQHDNIFRATGDIRPVAL